MKALMTGATGLLGRHLISALQERGDTIRVLVLPDDDASSLAQPNVTICWGDVREIETLLEPMRGVDTVFHLAGMMGVWRPLGEYRAVNATGAENVCLAALRLGVRRVVHVSSWTVYGTGRGRLMYENDAVMPDRDPYARTKAEGDQIVQRFIMRHHLPATIVRPGTFFGPGDHLHFGRIADRIRLGKAIIIGSGRNALPLVYVTDVVQGLLLAADSPKAIGQIYNITNDCPLTQEELLRVIAREVDGTFPRLHIPYPFLLTMAMAAERSAALGLPPRKPLITRFGVKLFGTDNRHAIDRARHELGYEPEVDLRDGLRLTATWYKQRIQARDAGKTAVSTAGG